MVEDHSPQKVFNFSVFDSQKMHLLWQLTSVKKIENK